jgi:hypothetical protein
VKIRSRNVLEKVMNARFVRAAIAGVVAMVSLEASALTYPSGTISNLYISGETNFAVRVYLNGVADPCGNGGSAWAFINATDSNYKVYVAGLMMAKAQGNYVTLLVAPDGANPSYCRLVEFRIDS